MIVYKVVDLKFDAAGFGRAVREQRQRARLTKRALAELMGRSDSHVAQIERGGNAGTLAVEDMVRLCNLFDLDPRQYFLI
jgi:transcriptional regulator with XRE-family HTH domain